MLIMPGRNMREPGRWSLDGARKAKLHGQAPAICLKNRKVRDLASLPPLLSAPFSFLLGMSKSERQAIGRGCAAEMHEPERA